MVWNFGRLKLSLSTKLLGKTLPLAALALLAAWLVALDDFAAPPRPTDLAAAAQAAVGQPGWAGGLALALWDAGGGAALGWTRWAITLLAAWALFFVILCVAGWWGLRARRWAIFGILAAGSVVGFRSAWYWAERRLDIDLALPLALFSEFPEASGEFFVNPSARPAAALLARGHRLQPCSLEDALLASDPPRWRERLRAARWSAVLLAGPPAECAPLLDHLAASPDWHLAAISHHGWLFFRGKGPVDGPEILGSSGSALSRAIAQAQLAERLAMAGKGRQAEAALNEALKNGRQSPHVRYYAGRVAARWSQWGVAADHARAAVAAGHPSAWFLLARALLETGDWEGAKKAAQRAVRIFPRDAEAHFLLARVERARNHPAGEVEALERAVATARAAGVSPAPYLPFLGQARAKLGDARGAAAAYEEALAAGTLGDAERKAVQEALRLLQDRDLR